MAPSSITASSFKAPTEMGYDVDIELLEIGNTQLLNNSIESFAWKDIRVLVKDNKSEEPKAILDGVDGVVKAGEILAILGPSGCGKTTLLNVLSNRVVGKGVSLAGVVYVNGCPATPAVLRETSSYVEQEDALIGSLTVSETLHFAARLAHKNTFVKSERIKRINGLLDSFGLRNQCNTLIGTPVRKGISGGQKRRVSVASQLITAPKILFLDEPTSGLDSAASQEVISYVKDVAKRNNLIVIASIHQPSTSTFQLFDKLLLLSAGKSHYFGSVDGVAQCFDSIGHSIPLYMNPAEFLLDLMNTDFANSNILEERLVQIHKAWTTCVQSKMVTKQIENVVALGTPVTTLTRSHASFLVDLQTLVHRSFIKSYRDVVAYGVRVAMYTGLAIMMGTVWLRLDNDQSSIQPFINAIFFGSAFMSFMAVAYVPSFLEDRANYVKERANGLYGPSVFVASNFIIGLPYLFIIAVLFSSIAYWLSGFQPTAAAFFTWIMWLFLDLIAAESLVVLVSSLFPNFVISLALTAFANGLWMSVGGFLVPRETLNVFWRYVFHYIDYQSYVFQGMMVNEFANRTYSCDSTCHCIYQTELAQQCQISGIGVLNEYGYKTGRTGQWIGILLGITLGYRLLSLLVLAFRK